METRALACCMEQQTIPAQKHSETKITSFRPQCATKVPFEKCRNWCPNVSHKNLSSSKSEHRSIYSSSFQTDLTMKNLNYCRFFFFPAWYIKVLLSILSTPPPHFHTPQNKRLPWCSATLVSAAQMATEKMEQNSLYSILMTKDLWDYNSSLGHLFILLPFVQLLCLFRMQKQKDRTVHHPAQKEFKFCLESCTTL